MRTSGASPSPSRAFEGGFRGTPAGSFIQLVGSALQVTHHFHSLVPDGVFVPGEGGVRSEALPPPTQGEVERLLRVERHWVLRLLEKTSKPSLPVSHEGAAGVPESIRQWIAEEVARRQ